MIALHPRHANIFGLPNMSSTEGIVEPEQVYVKPMLHVPNSRLPAIIYRSVFKTPLDQVDVIEYIQSNGWMKGGQWKTYKIPHFHSNTHECYAVISGQCDYVLGVSPLDEPSGDSGKVISVSIGDVFVLPVDLSVQ